MTTTGKRLIKAAEEAAEIAKNPPAQEDCDYCIDHVPPTGYWRCPVCDAEWPEEDDK
jgi:hypothetical protein